MLQRISGGFQKRSMAMHGFQCVSDAFQEVSGGPRDFPWCFRGLQIGFRNISGCSSGVQGAFQGNERAFQVIGGPRGDPGLIQRVSGTFQGVPAGFWGFQGYSMGFLGHAREFQDF